MVAGALGLVGVVAADGSAARLEVATLTVITLAGFVAHARWPRMPAVLLATWTFVPAIVLSLRERGEGTMFLLVVALSTARPDQDDRQHSYPNTASGVAPNQCFGGGHDHRARGTESPASGQDRRTNIVHGRSSLDE